MQMSDDRCQKTDVRRRMTEDRGQRTEDRGQKLRSAEDQKLRGWEVERKPAFLPVFI
jgi:hypothetical protein